MRHISISIKNKDIIFVNICSKERQLIKTVFNTSCNLAEDLIFVNSFTQNFINATCILKLMLYLKTDCSSWNKLNNL
ncbi:hypothetical protein T01_10563 [Trichinella spiralis]|uniref:Uncharacterized protein n=1 Tax=Trichinella spiralis TaxID=6334 RepID=A0A0V1BN38_TRISP|nr:hypothetical protein T01_10563 [Trichinella spiralis]